MSYAQWVSIYVCSFMQLVIFCFTYFVYYCMPIYVPSLNKDFIIIIIIIYIPFQACFRSVEISLNLIKKFW